VSNVPSLDFWFEFASTYSYPAAMRIAPLAHQAGVTVRFRPFLLGPVFQAQGWSTSPFNLYAAKGGNMWRDLDRLCADFKLSFRRPEPFPQNSLLAARVALVGLGTAGERSSGEQPSCEQSWDGQSWGGQSWDGQSWGEQFCRAVFLAEFCDGLQIDDVAVLSDILARLNVKPEPVFDAARTDTNKARLRAQTEEAQRLGIFGAPSFVTADGELFWGNDRLERALAWAKNGR
jgi:2-hydroxychromene-2-carboxylate isomerase